MSTVVFSRRLGAALSLVVLASACAGDITSPPEELTSFASESDEHSHDVPEETPSHGGSHDAARSPSHGSHEESADAVPEDTHDAHGITPIAPSIDRALLPEGDPGVSDVEITTTDEQPAVGDGVGSFRTRCLYSHMNFDDPIVFPGKPDAAHLHTYFGNTAADAHSTAESLKNTGNSTCRGGIANRTAYWVPTLIDGEGAPIEPVDADMYYKTGYEGVAPQSVQPFPQGIRMIAGDMHATEPQLHAYWTCRETYIGRSASVPECPPGESVVMNVQFPQCWDGVNLDSPDHKSHLAYPQGGACPSTHPVPIPEISFKVYYDLAPGEAQQARLSSDAYGSELPGGLSAHGDYFEAWDPDVVKTFVENCLHRGVDCHSHLLGDGRMIFNRNE